MNLLNGLATDFCGKVIDKLVQCPDSCLNRKGDYVENRTYD
jgi:hypothetical protein